MKAISKYFRLNSGHGFPIKKSLFLRKSSFLLLLASVFCLAFLIDPAMAEEPPVFTPVPTLSGLAKNAHLLLIAAAGVWLMRREKKARQQRGPS